MYPTFESWETACSMMRKENRRLKSYLQWYPFSQLCNNSWDYLASEGFYNYYIKDGAFLLCETTRFVTKGYIQKQGSSLRDSYLVSPVLYLFLLAYGIEYFKTYNEPRRQGLAFYAGDFSREQSNYQRSWQAYCNALKYDSNEFKYCLKTDISNFFGTLNVDLLVAKMEDCSSKDYLANDGFFFKALLLYCGNGNYPIIQNHPTLSFLATNVFLGDIDVRLTTKLESMSSVKSFNLIRYVDDMCIFFDVAEDSNLTTAKHEIIYRVFASKAGGNHRRMLRY